MRLDEYLAKAFSRWPFHLLGTVYQTEDKWVRCTKGGSLFKADSLYEDWSGVEVDIHRFEAERERIATNHQSTQEARTHAEMCWEMSKGEDLTLGKRSKEDQALWDKVAVAAFGYLMMHEYQNLSESAMAVDSFDFADAFMAERAKRMKG